MAKKIKRRAPLKLKEERMVQVNSRTYGKHTRAARGSKSAAPVNALLASQAENTAAINAAAKSVYDVLKFYTENFKEGQLWQNILSRMRKSKEAGFEAKLCALKGLEINNRYRLTRFGNAFLMVNIQKKILQAALLQHVPPKLHKQDNCYAYLVICLLFGNKQACIQHTLQATEWMYKKDSMATKAFDFEVPAKAVYYLLCLDFKGGIDNVATHTLGSRGMCVMAGGNVTV